MLLKDEGSSYVQTVFEHLTKEKEMNKDCINLLINVAWRSHFLGAAFLLLKGEGSSYVQTVF